MATQTLWLVKYATGKEAIVYMKTIIVVIMIRCSRGSLMLLTRMMLRKRRNRGVKIQTTTINKTNLSTDAASCSKSRLSNLCYGQMFLEMCNWQMEIMEASLTTKSTIILRNIFRTSRSYHDNRRQTWSVILTSRKYRTWSFSRRVTWASKACPVRATRPSRTTWTESRGC